MLCIQKIVPESISSTNDFQIKFSKIDHCAASDRLKDTLIESGLLELCCSWTQDCSELKTIKREENWEDSPNR